MSLHHQPVYWAEMRARVYIIVGTRYTGIDKRRVSRGRSCGLTRPLVAKMRYAAPGGQDAATRGPWRLTLLGHRKYESTHG